MGLLVSELPVPAATEFRNADVLVANVLDVTSQITRQLLLTGEGTPGQDFALRNAASEIAMRGTGEIVITMDGTQPINFNISSGASFEFNIIANANDALTWNGTGFTLNTNATAVTGFLQAGIAWCQIDSLGNVILQPTGTGTIFVSINLTPGNWTGTPTNVQDAVERLAAAVAGLLGGPIP